MRSNLPAKDKALPGRAGIWEVAHRAGVGIASVSRALSGQPGVSAKMRRRVLQAAERVGYIPNLVAQGLRRRKTRSVGFVLSDISNPLLSSIVAGAEWALSRAGYSVLLTNSAGEPELDAERVQLLLQRQVDGLIILPSREDDPATIAALQRAEVPIIVIDRTLPADVKATFVLSDHYLGVGDAARHLLALGHRRIALVVGPDVRPSRERIRAVADAYATHSLPPRFVVDHGTLSAEHGERSVARLLDSAVAPTAIILGGNQLLEGALRMIRNRGIILGKDLSLVCCDDIPLGRLNQPPIATVHRDTVAIGRTAAECFLKQMEKSSVAASTMLPTWFEPRESCGAPPATARGSAPKPLRNKKRSAGARTVRPKPSPSR